MSVPAPWEESGRFFHFILCAGTKFIFMNVGSVFYVSNVFYFQFSGQPSDNSTGIGVAISSTTTGTSVSKSMITNASFRTKKLPGKNIDFHLLIENF